jgi:hypothetical protein
MTTSEYKIIKYSNKLKNCDNDSVKCIYNYKLSKYLKQNAGFGITNALVVFNASKLSGSPLESLLNEKGNIKLTDEKLMSKSDLEKLLLNAGYFINEQQSEAELIGKGFVSGLVESAKQKMSTVDLSILTNTDTKKIENEIKNMESSLVAIKKSFNDLKISFSKKTENVTKLKENYQKHLDDYQKQDLPVFVECVKTILTASDTILSSVSERNNKMNEFEKIISEAILKITSKLDELKNFAKDIDELNSNMDLAEKTYDGDVKLYKKCITPDEKIKLTNQYFIANYKEICEELKEKTKDKMLLDAYMICTFKTFGENIITQIGKF